MNVKPVRTGLTFGFTQPKLTNRPDTDAPCVFAETSRHSASLLVFGLVLGSMNWGPFHFFTFLKISTKMSRGIL